MDLKGAWTGPAALDCSTMPGTAGRIPVLEIVSAMHILADLTLVWVKSCTII